MNTRASPAFVTAAGQGRAPASMPSRRPHGFTLIEMMIVVAIVGILGSVAYPSYMEYIKRTRRTDATRALMEASAALEQYFSQHQAYPDNTATTLADIYRTTSPEGYYKLTLVTPNANSYALTAEPTGAQASDGECKDFTLNSLGVRGNTGAATDAVHRCWNR